MNKQRFIILIAVLAAVACISLAVQQRLRFPLVNAVVISVLAPFNKGVRAVTGLVKNTGEELRTRDSLQQENKELKKELEGLRGLEFRTADLEAENALLNRLVGYKEQHPEQRLLPATVIGMNLGDLQDNLLLDRGSSDGLYPDMVVVSTKGIAGVIVEVYPNSSRMLLLTGSGIRIGARVLRADSRAVGVITGRSLAEAPIKMEYLAREADIKEGDTIVTSGFGGKYPAGLLIGSVKKIELDAAGLLKIANIEPASKLDNLEKVFVILGIDSSKQLPPAKAQDGKAPSPQPPAKAQDGKAPSPQSAAPVKTPTATQPAAAPAAAPAAKEAPHG